MRARQSTGNPGTSPRRPGAPSDGSRGRAAAAWAVAAAVVVIAACAPDAETDGTETPQNGVVELVEGTRSEAAFPGASVEIVAPDSGAVLSEGSVDVRLAVEGFELGASTPGAEERGIALSDQGQHVHLILDERPYEAIYDVSEPFTFQGVEPGFHVLQAFASRQWHESVKQEGAFDLTWFFVGDTTDGMPFDPAGPLLTYSRPKGTYEGPAADSVMVDFYLTNSELGEEYVVRLTVDDSLSFEIDEWVPHYLVGLSEGQHTIGLQLLDAGLQPVGGELSATERTITVAREPAAGTETAANGGEGR